jgi:hypothetical protein
MSSRSLVGVMYRLLRHASKVSTDECALLMHAGADLGLGVRNIAWRFIHNPAKLRLGTDSEIRSFCSLATCLTPPRSGGWGWGEADKVG